jgi:hypothetical protein
MFMIMRNKYSQKTCPIFFKNNDKGFDAIMNAGPQATTRKK